MGIISKLFGQKKKKYAEDSYLHSELIYANDSISLAYTNQEKQMSREEKIKFIEDNAGLADTLFTETSNIIILMDFSVDYMADAAEFLSAGIIPAKFAQGGYEKELEDLDTHGDPQVLYVPKYYILIGGTIDNYLDLFRFTPNLSNPFIQAIQKELCNGIHKCFFRELIYDGVFKESDFNPDPPIYPNYSITQTEEEQDIVSIISYDPIDKILEKLPDCFTGEDLLYFTKINMLINRKATEGTMIGTNLNIALINNIFFSNEGDKVVSTIVNIISREGLYNSVFKNVTMEKLQQLTMPAYRRALDPDDTIFGKVSDEQIDSIFKEQYDKFTGVKTEEEIIYKDIDEVVGNDVKSDIEEGEKKDGK